MFDQYKNFEYYYYEPKVNDRRKLPILFDIHGAGRRGRDVKLLTSVGLEKDLEAGLSLPCVVVAPQCFADTWFDVFEQLKGFILAMIERFHVDSNRVNLMGTSMGGYCAWQLLESMPELFRRAVICCGGGMYWNAGRIKAEVRAYHGSLDTVVFPEESKKMCDAVNANGGRAEWTLFEGLDHNCWDRVFSDREILNWLIGE